MALDIIGRIIQILPTSSGVSKAGKEWVKQEFVIETQEQYPKKVCIGTMNEKTKELSRFKTGEDVKVAINVESREYNGKWYTNINAWKIEPAGSGSAASAAVNENPFHNDVEPAMGDTNSVVDDLPF